jgi:hypothetical protein
VYRIVFPALDSTMDTSSCAWALHWFPSVLPHFCSSQGKYYCWSFLFLSQLLTPQHKQLTSRL